MTTQTVSFAQLQSTVSSLRAQGHAVSVKKVNGQFELTIKEGVAPKTSRNYSGGGKVSGEFVCKSAKAARDKVDELKKNHNAHGTIRGNVIYFWC